MWEYIGNVGIGPGFPEVQDLGRRGRPVREPRPHDVICQTRTRNARGANAAAPPSPSARAGRRLTLAPLLTHNRQWSVPLTGGRRIDPWRPQGNIPRRAAGGADAR